MRPCEVLCLCTKSIMFPMTRLSRRASASTGFTSHDAGEKGLKGCDYIASEPAKVEKRCSRRVGEVGVPALEACKQTCGKC